MSSVLPVQTTTSVVAKSSGNKTASPHQLSKASDETPEVLPKMPVQLASAAAHTVGSHTSASNQTSGSMKLNQNINILTRSSNASTQVSTNVPIQVADVPTHTTPNTNIPIRVADLPTQATSAGAPTQPIEALTQITKATTSVAKRATKAATKFSAAANLIVKVSPRKSVSSNQQDTNTRAMTRLPQ